jgi:hypothetical protein
MTSAFDSGRHQGDYRVHVSGDTRCGVECYRGPDRVHIGFRYAVTPEEVARGMRAIDFKALRLATVTGHQPQVMKHRAGVQQLPVGHPN